jgi:hypothetical protein
MAAPAEVGGFAQPFLPFAHVVRNEHATCGQARQLRGGAAPQDPAGTGLRAGRELWIEPADERRSVVVDGREMDAEYRVRRDGPRGIALVVNLRRTTPGSGIDPPVSEPVASVEVPAAKAAADPPLDPPGECAQAWSAGPGGRVTAHGMLRSGPQPRPMNGILVAVMVRNWTLVSSGSDVM